LFPLVLRNGQRVDAVVLRMSPVEFHEGHLARGLTKPSV
jgi:hypothetical protein